MEHSIEILDDYGEWVVPRDFRIVKPTPIQTPEYGKIYLVTASNSDNYSKGDTAVLHREESDGLSMYIVHSKEAGRWYRAYILNRDLTEQPSPFWGAN